jgi:alpha-mannosidase
VVLSACKPADDRSSVILRVFEAAGGTEALAVSAGAPVRAAYLADLAEHRQEACRVDGNRVELPVGPSRIVTLELELEGR